jgi:vancomycin resistance protein YoaR
VVRALLWLAAGVGAALLAVGILFAGSSSRIPAGVEVAGIKLSGLSPAEAEAILSDLADKYARIPVVVEAAGRRVEIEPASLDVRVDWATVVADARAAGDAPLPLRGLRRVQLRLFGHSVDPPVDLYDDALDFRLRGLAAQIAVPPREPAIVLDGLEPRLVPGQTGRELDLEASRPLLVEALASFERDGPVVLPVKVDEPDVAAAELQPVLAQVRIALSAPLRLALGPTRWRVRPPRLARMLVLPADGRTQLELGGAETRRYFSRLAQSVERAPVDAGFEVVDGGRVQVVPSREGRRLDAEASAEALLAAALSPAGRLAELVVATQDAELTTQEAESYGITQMLASYATAYAGTADRIHNLQLAVDLIDGTLVAPGAEFSFNEVVGERTLERGFRIAPVIIAGEYEEDVGGGVSQVATTVFNAAWESGLKVLERYAHALYISRYPLGRDATVNYPDQDLRFLNDTDGWLLVRGGYDESGISITILGPDTGRRVESEAGPLREVAPPKLKKQPDPSLFKGERVIEDPGEPARTVTVRRRVWEGGTLLYDETWTTSYRSEPKIVRVGTKPKPEPEKPVLGETPGTPPAEAGTPPAEPPPVTQPPAPEEPPGG